MNFSTRLMLVVGVLIALFVGFASAQPKWAADLGLDWSGLSDMPELFVHETGRQRELDYHKKIVDHRLRAKQQIIEEVLEDRLSLLEAAAGFRDLNRTPEDSPCQVGRKIPGNSDEERLCRQVISWAEGEARRKTPDRADSLVARLEAELQDHIRQHGTVRLPEQ
jgi:hypothetical protein